jgi:uncharacterized membrane protein/glutaredoxin
MGKAARSKKSRAKGSTETAALRDGPNWPLFGLALIGMGLSVYLTLSAWSGQAVAGCTEGSACDVVLSSRWATLLGLPTSLWGFLAYAGLAGIAWMKSEGTQWKLAWMVSLFGVLYSAYLTSVSFIVLQAACPYCLTSLGLMTAIFATVTYQRPENLSGFSWRPWLLKNAAGSLLLVIALHLQYTGIWATPAKPEEPWIRGLAQHLAKVNAKFYGASWCPHCIDQKDLFGSSAHRIPYVECSPQGRGRPQAALCNDAGIKSYPTWIIDGQRYIGTQPLDDLAKYSRYKGETQ